MMTKLRLSLLMAVAVAGVMAAPSPGKSSGSSNSAITFGTVIQENRKRPWDQKRPVVNRNPPHRQTPGSSIQFGETNAFSEQHSSGDGQQTNTGQASGVSVQQQSGLGGATQTTNNQALIQAAQGIEGSGSGSGGSQQTSNNQVNINSQQTQQNVEGTLVNVQAGNEGVVVVNTNDPTGAIVHQEVINNRPKGETTSASSKCRYVCLRAFSREPYCCDDGSNTRGNPNEIHGGQCPETRALCNRNQFFKKCAHDGQCAPSDKCCYDSCIQHHICKSAD